MKPVFKKVLTDIKITKEEKETLLKADKILDDIYETLCQNDLNDEMKELFEDIKEINSIEEIVNVYLTWD